MNVIISSHPPSVSPHPTEFRGTQRFDLRQSLGAGAFGEVFRAFDRKLQAEVALKVLHRGDALGIARFKQEFRVLADLAHGNLIQLYELLADGDRWFFTMELLRGDDFLRTARLTATTETPSSPADFDQLRASLRQLANGLVALHRHDKLHCDIKPSNVFVTTEGRTVLLDFGLALRLAVNTIESTQHDGLAGTPAYISPEQASGERLGPAADWYAVGVVLFEAMTGCRPFVGGLGSILQAKHLHDGPSPQTLLPNLPDDLSDLCQRMMRRDPRRRPKGEEILDQLGGAQATQRSSTALPMASNLIGRQAQQAALRQAFDHSCRGRTTVVLLEGSSGTGKSALVRRFLKEASEAVPIEVFSGRCYERESVPYKALDGVVEQMGRFLRRLEPDAAKEHSPDRRIDTEALLPADIQTLARLFPALRRLAAVAEGIEETSTTPDERQLRHQAREAFRSLVGSLAKHWQLILHIEDLQWGDLDSISLIAELLRPPAAPPLLLIVSYRSEEKASSPILSQLRQTLELAMQGGELRVDELAVEALEAEDSMRLALQTLGGNEPHHQAVARTIAHEARGNPFFIVELARYFALETTESPGQQQLPAHENSSGLTVEELIAARQIGLTAAATSLLEILAIAGRPLAIHSASEAAAITGEAPAAISLLSSRRLIRRRFDDTAELLETYHERTREAVASSLPRERRQRLHRRLGQVLEAHGAADAETLAAHFRAADHPEREAHHLRAAAERARDTLAFVRAARLFRRALELKVRDAHERHCLQVELGDALTHAGRGAEAAQAYLQAAATARGDEAIELRRQAAEQQLFCGQIDDGIETMREVLAAVGLHWPTGRRRVLLSVLWQRAQLKLRGFGFREISEAEADRDQLVRLDTCWTVSSGFAHIDPILGMEFATRHLLLALRLGEPKRVARALATEAAYTALPGAPSRQRALQLLAAAEELAERLDDPYLKAIVAMVAGITDILVARFEPAFDHFRHSEYLFREHCIGAVRDHYTVSLYYLRVLLFTGRLEAVRQYLPSLLQDVVERGDLYAEVNLRSRVTWSLHLAADQPDLASHEIDTADRRWPYKGFRIQHYWQLLGRTEVALYRGDGEIAWQVVEDTWPRLRGSRLLKIQLARVECIHMRGRAALAAAIGAGLDSPIGKRRLADVATSIQAIDKERLEWARPLAQLLRAGRASAQGRDIALRHLTAAAAGFSKTGMQLHVAVSHWCHGSLIGPDGAPISQPAAAWMASQGIANIERMVAAVAPGVWLPT